MFRIVQKVTARNRLAGIALMISVVALVGCAAYVVAKSVHALQRRMEFEKLAALVAGEMKSLTLAHDNGGTKSPGDKAPIEDTVARMLPDVPFTDLLGKSGSLRDYRGRVVVVSMTSVGCPISKKLIPKLARLPGEFGDEKVQFLIVNTEAGASRSELEKHAALFPNWRYVPDPEARLARALGARTTAETFVIDEAQTLRYRGAVDDRLDVGVNRDAVEHDYLRDAVSATLSDRPVRPRAVPAPGCLLAYSPSTVAPLPVTWHNQISRFVQYNCVECHRPGEAGPFALETYAQVVDKQAMIEYVLEEQIMPPWFADHDCGEWENSRFVADAERQLFSQWVAEGCVEGDAADAPVPLKWTSGWTIQQPDVVIDIEPQHIPAEGAEPWRTFTIEFEVPEDMWVSEAEIRPSAPEVVHHAMLFVEYADDDPRRLTQDSKSVSDSTGGFWLSYFPGRKAMILPPGRGKLIPRGGKISIQMHYNPNGTDTTDKARIGLKLLPGPPEKAVVTSSVRNQDFIVPPNSRVEFLASRVLDEDIRLLALMPHMHYRGAAAQFFIQHADGRFESLLNVPTYDFDWQVSYEFREPQLVTRGSRLVIRHEFDNTTANPHNPDATKELRHGDKTTDEMMINFFDWEPVVDDTSLTGKTDRPFRKRT